MKTAWTGEQLHEIWAKSCGWSSFKFLAAWGNQHQHCRARWNALAEHLNKLDASLDAYEKGIRDAAEAACDSQKYYPRDASVQCLQIHDRILALLTKPKDKE